MTIPALPYPRSYWVQPGRLLAGFIPGSFDPKEEHEKLTALCDAGVTHIINLMEEGERNRAGVVFRDYRPAWNKIATARGADLGWTRHAIKDMNIPTAEEMVCILDTVDAVMKDGCAYVHCWGGKGRTGTVIGCWLARHGGNGLALLRELTENGDRSFREVPQTDEQRDFVRNWRAGQ